MEQIFLCNTCFYTARINSSPAPLKLHIQHYTNVIIIIVVWWWRWEGWLRTMAISIPWHQALEQSYVYSSRHHTDHLLASTAKHCLDHHPTPPPVRRIGTHPRQYHCAVQYIQCSWHSSDGMPGICRSHRGTWNWDTQPHSTARHVHSDNFRTYRHPTCTTSANKPSCNKRVRNDREKYNFNQRSTNRFSCC